MTSHDQQKDENVIIQDLEDLPDEEQLQKLADHLSAVPNEYEQLKTEDIDIPPVAKKDIPQFQPVEIWMKLTELKKMNLLF